MSQKGKEQKDQLRLLHDTYSTLHEKIEHLSSADTEEMWRIHQEMINIRTRITELERILGEESVHDNDHIASREDRILEAEQVYIHGAVAEARRQFLSLLSEDITDAEVLWHLAEIYLDLGDQQKYSHYIDRAISMAEQQGDSNQLFIIGYALHTWHDLGRTYRCYQAVMMIGPEGPDAEEMVREIKAFVRQYPSLSGKELSSPQDEEDPSA